MSEISLLIDDRLFLNRLGVVMKEERWSNKKLADKTGYDKTTISLWVNNHVQPSVATFALIALLMNRNLQDLFDDTTKLSAAEKERYLAELKIISERAKKTGKHKKDRTAIDKKSDRE